MMKLILSACVIIMLCSCDAKVSYLETIQYNGHTYIHFHNMWNHAGDSFIHDPGCECLKIKKE